ncbi:hypothetical protein COU75_03430 [Candidatus Peregrinibacteria bacterium CG10_big_fil_rev_8_21_14_0_10_42_8]|nr:MAG: hypothetical protein COU75_03430 [Candidatus Peregrinibacteria bacterium CG10_big_fil_rev_8_21_14_0_10_42_8]
MDQSTWISRTLMIIAFAVFMSLVFWLNQSKQTLTGAVGKIICTSENQNTCCQNDWYQECDLNGESGVCENDSCDTRIQLCIRYDEPQAGPTTYSCLKSQSCHVFEAPYLTNNYYSSLAECEQNLQGLQYNPRCEEDYGNWVLVQDLLFNECQTGVVPPCSDADMDGTCDEVDGCPNDPNKIKPGPCGCIEGQIDNGEECDGGDDCTTQCVCKSGYKWDDSLQKCTPKKCNDCEQDCYDSNGGENIYDDNGKVKTKLSACRIACFDTYNGVDGDACSALCNFGNTVDPSGNNLCPDGVTCCSEVCIDTDKDGKYTCSGAASDTTSGGDFGGVSKIITSSGPVGDPIGSDSGGNGDTGDIGGNGGSSPASGSSTSSNSSRGICDEDQSICENKCLCDYKTQQDANDLQIAQMCAVTDHWWCHPSSQNNSTNESYCTAFCDDEAPPLDNNSSQSNGYSQSSISSKSSTPSSFKSSPASSENSASSQVSVGFHYACIDLSCTLFLEEGEDSCATDEDCIYEGGSSTPFSSIAFNSSLSSLQGPQGSSVYTSEYISSVSSLAGSTTSSAYSSVNTSHISERSLASLLQSQSSQFIQSESSQVSYIIAQSESSYQSIILVYENGSSAENSYNPYASYSSGYSAGTTISGDSINYIYQDDNGDGDNDDGIANNHQWTTPPSTYVQSQRDGTTYVAAASVCGDGVLAGSEECDDRNRRDNDGCSSTCLLEIGICGDGKVQTLLGEQCESSLHDASLPYTCSNCRFISLFCGDGKLDPGEECDEGNQNSTLPDALCRPDCSQSRCGDAILDTAETCDDGNRKNNDGCDRYCRVETQDGKKAVQVAAENTTSGQQQNILGQQFQFPQFPTGQPVPYQLPYAQLQPLIQTQGPVGDTGPAAVAVIGAGAAAGVSWMRKKRRK